MKGIYLLLIRLETPVITQVGALGKIYFPEGYYIYVGSAQNSLESRLARHLIKNKKKHWHIDYLLEHGDIIQIIVYPNLKKFWEERIAKILERRYIPVFGFGCSDSESSSHLFFLENLWRVSKGAIFFLDL